jgi:hypothetical protein
MKFASLPLRQRFVYQGETYTKTGPLTASRDRDGVQRMIPRSAALLPADGAAPRPGPAGGNDLGRPWLAALDAYEQELRTGLRRLGVVPDERLDAALGAARAAFNAAIRGVPAGSGPPPPGPP